MAPKMIFAALTLCVAFIAVESRAAVLPNPLKLIMDKTLAIAFGDRSSDTKCGAWPTQTQFAPKRFFNGEFWYVVASHFDTGATCTTENYTWTEEFSGTGYGQQIQTFEGGHQANLTFELDRNSMEAASFYYPYTVKTFLIVDTDYDNYAVVADCAENWVPQPQAVSIYSRKPKLPDNYKDLSKKLANLGYDVTRLTLWSVKDC